MKVSDEKELEEGKLTEVPSPILQGVSFCLISSSAWSTAGSRKVNLLDFKSSSSQPLIMESCHGFCSAADWVFFFFSPEEW